MSLADGHGSKMGRGHHLRLSGPEFYGSTEAQGWRRRAESDTY
jgi:hypothetical protein